MKLLEDGPVLQFILLDVSAIFWYGFALPFGPIGAIAQMMIWAITWKSFR
jgi:hypothetical protein